MNNYNQTLYACYLGYITQAIVNNFAPLLFLTFQRSYGIALDRIAFLVTFNFGVQLCVDFLAAKRVDQIGYRRCIVTAHLFAATGLIGMGVLPEILPNPYLGLLIFITCYAIGGGLIEVLVSPIVEACPTQRKEAAMSLLHSFYCWGHVFVVTISTLYFVLIGVDYDKNTSLHLADVRAEYPGKHTTTESSAMLINGVRQWVSYETLYVDGEDFLKIGKAFEKSHPVKTVQIGNATVRCMEQRELVDFAVSWIEKNRLPVSALEPSNPQVEAENGR